MNIKQSKVADIWELSKENFKKNLGCNTLTGNPPHTKKPKRPISEQINFSDNIDGYAYLVAHGFDSLQECYNLKIKKKYWDKFEKLKEQARELDSSMQTNIDFNINTHNFGHVLQMCPVATRGCSFKIECENFQFMIKSNGMDWGISVRYLSGGLWQHGIDELRLLTWDILKNICEPPKEYNPDNIDFVRLSRIDFAFDFHSPEFTKEMKPEIAQGIIASSKVKTKFNLKSEEVACYGAGGRLQTLTIGSKNRLQVQVYDKSQEIKDKPNKAWFKDVWEFGEEFDEPPKTDIWRLELRFFNKFLRDRGILTLDNFLENMQELISEALICRRLAIPCSDSNRSRWTVHPLWTEAYHLAGCGCMLPVGKRLTETRQELKQRLTKQIAGSIRSLTILYHKKYDDDEMIFCVNEAVEALRNDEDHQRKTKKIQEKYRYIDEAG